MSHKEDIGKSLQKFPEKKNRGFFSKAYHRFFRGYSEIAVPGKGGKGTRIERIYTGDYYRQDLDRKNKILFRVVYVVFFVCSLLLFVCGAIYPHRINTTIYVTIPQAIGVGFLFWIFIIFYNYLPASEEMTIAEYTRSSRYLLVASLGATITLVALALASILFIILNPSGELFPLLLIVLEYLLAATFTLGINLLEKRIKYISYPSENKAPEEGYEIE